MANRLWDKEHNKERDPASVMEALGRIVSACIKSNSIDPSAVSPLIQQVFSTLINLQHTPHGRTTTQPAVDIEKSITPEYLICLEDGKQLKMLKRHLRTSYGLTPEQYRERWNLPIDYPMVAPNYARRRSSLARSNGLGVTGRKSAFTSAALAQ